MTTNTGGPRLLIYSQDGLGLGHLRRTTLLATEFLRARPGAAVMTISDSPLGQFFSPAPGHDYLKLPSIRKIRPGEWSPVRLSMPFDDVLALRRQIIRTAALSFSPDVFLVDHMPHGAMGELVPTLRALESRPVRVVLGLRDILDAPATIRQRWRLEGAFEAVTRHYVDVLVYGSKDVFDVAAEYGWPDHLSSRLRYCGYISAGSADPGSSRAREHGGGGTGPLVLAMAGGGADAYRLFDVLLRAVPALLVERRCTVVVVTGPFLPEQPWLDLQRRAAGLPVRLLRTVDDPLAWLRAADLVVAMAGYNTTAEILSVGRPALLVPRAGPSAEQRMRASRFAARGWVRWLPPASLSPEALAQEMTSALVDGAAPAAAAPDLSGRQRAARRLLAVARAGQGLRLPAGSSGPLVAAGASPRLAR